LEILFRLLSAAACSPVGQLHDTEKPVTSRQFSVLS
jgi:hypothetical protein